MFLVWGALLIGLNLFFLTFYWKVVTSPSKVLPSSVIFSDPFFYEGVILIGLPLLTLMYWLGEAPARALKDRASIGPEPTADEKRAIAFRKMTYGRLAFVGALALYWPVASRQYGYFRHGWHLGLAWVSALIVVIVAVQAFRKWRFERSHPELR